MLWTRIPLDRHFITQNMNLLLPLQPSLTELTRSATFARTTVDILNLGCIAYHVMARQPFN